MFLVIDIVVLSYYVLTYCFLFLLSFPVIPLSLFFLSSFSCYSFPVISFLLFLSCYFFPLVLFPVILSSYSFRAVLFLLFHSCFFRSPCFPADPPGLLQPASGRGLMRQCCSIIHPAAFSLLRCPRNGSSRMPGRLPHLQGFPQSPPLPRSLRRSHRRRVLS